MKQINNIKFYDAKDGEVRVVFPDGREDYFLEKDAKLYYKKLYDAKMIDKLVLESLKECDMTVDNAHLSDYNKLYQFQTKFKTKLITNGIDLPFKKITTNKLGIEVSGNTEGITSSVVMFLWCRPWEEVQFTKAELEQYLNQNKYIDVYMQDRYFAVKKVSRGWVLQTKFGTTFTNRGYGSGASVAENSVRLKKDKKGNLFISQSTMIWD